MELEQAKNAVMEASKQLVALGLVARTWGNVSCRVGEGSFLITPSGKPYEHLQKDQLVLVDLKDLSYPKGVKPSSEKKLHREVYALKKEIGCVIHTHQEMASLAGLLGRDIPVSKQGSALLKETIPVAEYGLPGTKSLVKNASHAIVSNNSRTVLLANHGALCFGLDAEETLEIARQLEIECREYLAKLEGKEGKAGSRSVPVEFTGLESDKASIPEEAMRIASSLKGGELRTMLFHSSPAVLEASNKLTHLPSYLDDFAQIAGARIAVVDSDSVSVRH
ncbi:MAG: class II aldolase/adducin family protein, partial [Sphaerochaeta sp.]|nr:class II aldolase/adducin family protein [Sphaerochaeta sp.]